MKISTPSNKFCAENEIFEEVLSLDGQHILELGCGRADKTRLIATGGEQRQVIATEVDETQHEKNMQITDLPNVTFKIAGCEAIPLADNSIDTVFMFKSLHHVPPELMEKGLSEIHRVLKPGGLAYISEPVFAGDFNEILRLFHDEQQARETAFNVIKKSVENNLFTLKEQLFFNTPSDFANFDEFESRIIQVTHTDHEISADVQHQIKQKFMQHMQDDGAHFKNPIRVDLLKK